MKELENPALGKRIKAVWGDFAGAVDQDLYSLLRFMCEKRFKAHHVVLRNFNYLNMCEQCLEAEVNAVYSHAWLLVFMMACLLLYNRVIYQIVWFTCLCLCAMGLMAGNLRWVMKKTAREARNLWRSIQGLREEGEEEGEEEEEEEGEGSGQGGAGEEEEGEPGEGGAEPAAGRKQAGGARVKFDLPSKGAKAASALAQGQGQGQGERLWI